MRLFDNLFGGWGGERKKERESGQPRLEPNAIDFDRFVRAADGLFFRPTEPIRNVIQARAHLLFMWC